MENKINDKIIEIDSFLSELSEIVPSNYNQYVSNSRDRAACERFFEKIVEAVVDIGFMIVKIKKLQIPSSDREVFIILGKNKVIPSGLAIKLSEAKGMRNILAHEYGKVNDQLIYKTLKEEIIPDVKEYLAYLRKVI